MEFIGCDLSHNFVLASFLTFCGLKGPAIRADKDNPTYRFHEVDLPRETSNLGKQELNSYPVTWISQ